MTRKDCENATLVSLRGGVHRPARAAGLIGPLALVVGALASGGPASRTYAEGGPGSVRLWPSAVVIDDTVRLSDLCELTGFDPGVERTLTELPVAEAPPAGGSRVIHMDMVRSVLSSSDVNMATVTVSGATRCTITRPSDLTRPSRPVSTERSAVPGAERMVAAASHAVTLCDAVTDYFNTEFARYDGRADIVFDHTSQQVLDLSGPTYTFRVRSRGGSLLGLVQLEVEVLTGGKTVQVVPLVVQASMVRRVLIARRSINQDATIQSSDVELTPLFFTRLDKLGLDDAALAVGQRAKRFIPAGSAIDPATLESVPLVTRGQLVKLLSVSGAVSVVTTAKAQDDGLLGEVVTVRSPDRKRVEFDAVVVGPGTVQVGSESVAQRGARVAAGGYP